MVNLGLPKSGTTTLGHALKLSGLKVADYRIRPHQTDDQDLQREFVAQCMYRGYFQTTDPLNELDEFDGFAEISALRGGLSLWPQMDFGLIQAIRDHHPGVRFLASYRDPRALSNAMLRWSDLGTERLPQSEIPGLPAGFGETTHERMRWIEAHYAHLRQIFKNDDVFLEYDVSDKQAPAQISAHIGVSLKWWGKTNKNKALPGSEAA